MKRLDVFVFTREKQEMKSKWMNKGDCETKNKIFLNKQRERERIDKRLNIFALNREKKRPVE